MKKILFLVVISFLVGCSSQQPSSTEERINKEISSDPSASGGSYIFYIDPINGSMDNPGTSDFPWRTLEEVVKNNLIKTKDQHGNVINPDAFVHAGDTIILRSGFHGHVQIKNAFNDEKITVKSEEGADARLAELELISVKNWEFSGLKISPAFSNREIRTRNIVIIGDNGYFGNSSNIELNNSYIFSFLKEPELLSEDEWNDAKIGLKLGRNAKNLFVRNNYIQSTEFGISIAAPESIVEGNVVTDYSKDGIRLIASNTIVKYNVIKNSYVLNNGNHDDGIQAFSYKGVDIDSSSVIGNIILNRDTAGNPYPGGTQGIGFFDGPFYNILIEGNIVMSFTWHGVSIYDSVGGKIQNNFLYTPDRVGNKKRTRITLGTKNKGVNIENLLAGNVAHKYVLDENDIVEDVHNQILDHITEDNEVLFMKKLNTLLAYINSTYGETLEKANKKRVNEEFLLYGTGITFD